MSAMELMLVVRLLLEATKLTDVAFSLLQKLGKGKKITEQEVEEAKIRIRSNVEKWEYAIIDAVEDNE